MTQLTTNLTPNTRLSNNLTSNTRLSVGLGGGSVYGSTYKSIYNSFTTKPSDDVADAQNQMVASLVAAGYWDRLDRFFVFAGHTNDDGESVLDWKNPAE